MRFSVWLLAALALAAPEQRDYKRWLNQEAVWIISRSERDSFRKLQDDDARERFITQFWANRDPTPGTPRNEAQEEHYRRLKFAAEHFAETGPGWRSDRGRVYIIHGPPLSRSVDAEREVWTLSGNPNARYYKGPITLVFERTASAFRERLISESRYARQKAEERPGAPPNPLNQLPTTPRYRLVAAGPGFQAQPALTAGETDRYIADLLRSPGEVLEERKQEEARRRQRLEALREQVQSRISFEPLAFQLETALYPVADNPVALLQISLGRAELEAEATAADGPARFDVYCEARRADGSLADAFDTTLQFEPDSAASAAPGLTYTDQFRLAEGAHRIDCLARGLDTGRTGRRSSEIGAAPPLGDLALAPPILTQQVRQVAPQEEFDPLVLQDARFSPQARSFDPERPVFLLFHVFLPKGQAASDSVFFDYQIHTREQVFFRSPERPLPTLSGQAPLPYALSLDLSGLQAGEYFLMIKVQDFERGRYALQELPFALIPPS